LNAWRLQFFHKYGHWPNLAERKRFYKEERRGKRTSDLDVVVVDDSDSDETRSEARRPDPPWRAPASKIVLRPAPHWGSSQLPPWRSPASQTVAQTSPQMESDVCNSEETQTQTKTAGPWLVSLDLHNVLDVGPHESIPDHFDTWIQTLLADGWHVIILTFIGHLNQELRAESLTKISDWNTRLAKCLPINLHSELPLQCFITDSKRYGRGKCNFLWKLASGRIQNVYHIDDCPLICQECQDWGIHALRIRGPNPHKQHPSTEKVFTDLPSSLEYLYKTFKLPTSQARHI
jgi:hypothetical protein